MVVLLLKDGCFCTTVKSPFELPNDTKPRKLLLAERFNSPMNVALFLLLSGQLGQVEDTPPNVDQTVATTKASQRDPLILERPLPPQEARNSNVSFVDRLSLPIDSDAATRTASGLAIVIGGFLLIVVVTRTLRRSPLGSHEDLIRIVDRKSISSKNNLVLVQIHNKLMVLVETPTSIQKIDTIEHAGIPSSASGRDKANKDTQELLSKIKKRFDDDGPNSQWPEFSRSEQSYAA